MKIIKSVKNKIFAILLFASILCGIEYHSFFVAADVGVQRESSTVHDNETSHKVNYETLLSQKEAVLQLKKSEGSLEKSSGKRARNNLALTLDYITCANMRDIIYLQMSCHYIEECNGCARYIIRYIHNQDGKK